MNEQIEQIRQSLLSNLRNDLKENHLTFVSLLEKGTSENYYDFQKAKESLKDPIEPWSGLLSALLDLELGYDFCKITVENISKNNSDRDLHFHIRTYSLYICATLERVEALVKKMNRAGVVSDVEKILTLISESLKHHGLKQERNTAAHGRFVGTKAPIGGVQTKFYWEPHAIVHLDESHLDGWHESYGNNRKVLADHTQKEFSAFTKSIFNILKLINTLLKKEAN